MKNRALIIVVLILNLVGTAIFFFVNHTDVQQLLTTVLKEDEVIDNRHFSFAAALEDENENLVEAGDRIRARTIFIYDGDSKIQNATVSVLLDENLTRSFVHESPEEAKVEILENTINFSNITFEENKPILIEWSAYIDKKATQNEFVMLPTFILNDTDEQINLPAIVIKKGKSLPIKKNILLKTGVGLITDSPQVKAGIRRPLTKVLTKKRAKLEKYLETMPIKIMDDLLWNDLNAHGQEARTDDILKYQILFQNIGLNNQRDLTVRASIPAGTALIKDSLIVNVDDKKIKADIKEDSIEITPSYIPPGGVGKILFSVKVKATSGGVEQQTKISIKDITVSAAESLYNNIYQETVVIPEITYVEQLPNQQCFSRDFVQKTFQESTEQNLNALFPHAKDTITLYFENIDENVRNSIIKAVLAVSCNPVPENFDVETQTFIDTETLIERTRLRSASNKLTTGSASLATGSTSLATGSTSLATGSTSLATGSTSLPTGSTSLPTIEIDTTLDLPPLPIDEFNPSDENET